MGLEEPVFASADPKDRDALPVGYPGGAHPDGHPADRRGRQGARLLRHRRRPARQGGDQRVPEPGTDVDPLCRRGQPGFPRGNLRGLPAWPADRQRLAGRHQLPVLRGRRSQVRRHQQRPGNQPSGRHADPECSIQRPIFITDTAYTLKATDTQQYVGAYSAAPGSAANASAGVFNQWSGNVPYSKSAFGSLLVTNDYGVVGGRDDESDDNYRYRIQQKLQGRNGANEAALRFNLLQVPGIQDIVFTRLAGTFNCYVYGIAPTPAPSLLDAVQQTINDNVAFPLTGTAIAPDLVGISLVTTLAMSAGASTTDQDMVIGEAVAAAQDYIDNLTVGQQLVINEIADRIRNADARILDVGQPNKQIPEIFIWRSRDDGTRYSRSKVEYSFISCFITSPPPILVALPELMRWDSQILEIRKGGNGYGTRSLGDR